MSPSVAIDSPNIEQLQPGSIVSVDTQRIITHFDEQFELLKQELMSIKKSFEQQTQEVNELRVENSKLSDNCKALELRVKALESENQQQQQWARLQNLEIAGVPEIEGESTIEIVKGLAKCAGVQLNDDDVDFAHRVQPTT